VAEGEFGGLHQIASGEQTGESVRRVVAALRCHPWSGSGWRALIVNEADAMTANAAHVWLDVLENLPPRSVVVFTTNHAGKLPARLRDRCEQFHFEAGALLLLPHAQDLVDRVWAAEVGGSAPRVEDFGPAIDGDGCLSFRRLLHLMTPHVRAGKLPQTRTRA
jgi:DNA polymerase III delta subunit-like protein